MWPKPPWYEPYIVFYAIYDVAIMVGFGPSFLCSQLRNSYIAIKNYFYYAYDMKRFTTWALGGVIGGVIVALLWSVGVNADSAKIPANATPNDSSARQRLVEICNRTGVGASRQPGGHPYVAVAAYVDPYRFDNKEQGTIIYTSNFLWKKCEDVRKEVINFAVTGYPGVGEKSPVCPESGRYHNSWFPTYDCVKYAGVGIWSSAHGYYNPKNYAPGNGNWYWESQHQRNWDNVPEPFKSQHPPDTQQLSTNWPQVYIGKGEPNSSIQTRKRPDIHGQIRDWETREVQLQGQTTYKLSNRPSVCAFYNNQDGTKEKGCQYTEMQLRWNWKPIPHSFVSNITTNTRDKQGSGPDEVALSAHPQDEVEWHHKMQNQTSEGFSILKNVVWFGFGRSVQGAAPGQNQFGNTDERNKGQQVGTIAPDVSRGNKQTVRPGQWYDVPDKQTYKVTNQDVGKRLCIDMVVDSALPAHIVPRSPNDGGYSGNWLWSRNACVRVDGLPVLEPVANVSPNKVSSWEKEYDVEVYVKNTGETKSTIPSRTALTRFSLPLNRINEAQAVGMKTLHDTAKNAPEQVTNDTFKIMGASDVKTLLNNYDESQKQTFEKGWWAITGVPTSRRYTENDAAAINQLRAGRAVCYATFVEKYDHKHEADGDWRMSGVSCVKMVVSPYVQFRGGNVIAGRGFQLGDIHQSGSNKAQIATHRLGGGKGLLGSWGEFGLFAPDRIQSYSAGFGSGKDGAPRTPLLLQNNMTFANQHNFGFFAAKMGESGNHPRFTRKNTVTTASSQYNLGNRSLPAHVYATSQAINLPGAKDIKGTHVLYAPDATVSIEGDLVYSGDQVSHPRELPQTVIIAKDIFIREDVSRVDAWLLASGTINTCENGGGKQFFANLNLNRCTKTLEVNGPVATRNLMLRRIGKQTEDYKNMPGERFNLRSDAYLWLNEYDAGGSGSANTIHTDSITEMAPRF